MEGKTIFKLNSKSSIPKYKQLINSLLLAIENKDLEKGNKVPSINQIMKEFSISRDTVISAFNELKIRGIISSSPGKGYYIHSSETQRKRSVFLLFDELNAFKEILYKTFIKAIKNKASVDIYFHYFNKKIFRNLILENLHRYNTFIIMPVNFRGIAETIKEIDHANVFFLDQLNPEIEHDYPVIYQDFTKDMFNALKSGLERLKKYQKLILVYPGGKEPIGQKNGFLKFCREYKFDYEVINTLKGYKIMRHCVYIMPNDHDLVELVKQSKKQDLLPGNDIGIISYNDTPLKEVVADGISTISTDFEAMGKSLAEMVLNNTKKQIHNPASLIMRKSL